MLIGADGDDVLVGGPGGRPDHRKWERESTLTPAWGEMRCTAAQVPTTFARGSQQRTRYWEARQRDKIHGHLGDDMIWGHGGPDTIERRRGVPT